MLSAKYEKTNKIHHSYNVRCHQSTNRMDMINIKTKSSINNQNANFET